MFILDSQNSDMLDGASFLIFDHFCVPIIFLQLSITDTKLISIINNLNHTGGALRLKRIAVLANHQFLSLSQFF